MVIHKNSRLRIKSKSKVKDKYINQIKVDILSETLIELKKLDTAATNCVLKLLQYHLPKDKHQELINWWLGEGLHEIEYTQNDVVIRRNMNRSKDLVIFLLNYPN